jgi:spermidine synthase
MSEPRREALKLFLLGFLTLFLELVLIRYLAGSIWNLGYFPNLVLIGVFVGMGLGFVTHHHVSEQSSARLFHGAAWLLGVLAILVAVLRPAIPGFTGSQADLGGELFFTRTPEPRKLVDPLLFGTWFLMVVAVFGLVAQRTAKLFRLFAPLHAYTLDIAGSCSGILAFMAMSWFQTPAWFWFVAVALLFAAACETVRSKEMLISAASFAIVVGLAVRQDTRLMARPGFRGPLLVRWSPYQRVEYVDTKDVPSRIFVNGIAHQHIEDAKDLTDAASGVPYLAPYEERRRAGLPPYRNVLVLGAGSGNDVATALLAGAEHVDAVEIDPVIAELGRRFHPVHPYDDPRVNLVVGDGRAFLTRATARYDLIVFALTDSLVKVSPMAQLRLENYLFTEECVRRASELLSADGDLLFYNFYRQPWIRAKIERMVYDVSGHYPRQLYSRRDFAMLAAGRHNFAETPSVSLDDVDPSRDDWPFLYLRQRRIPRVYLYLMAGLTAGLLALGVALQRSARRFAHLREQPGGLAAKLAFAFMGVAFLLLETKSVIQFSLLFGTTWLNNSLVFLGVLLLVLAANWAATRVTAAALGIVFTLLVVSSLVTLVYPLGHLLTVESPLLRFVAASLLTFAPIFFANVLFSVAFRDQAVPEHVFGWNLIGATFGAVLEYTSLRFGYNALALIVVVCYAAAFAALLRSRAAHREPELLQQEIA